MKKDNHISVFIDLELKKMKIKVDDNHLYV